MLCSCIAFLRRPHFFLSHSLLSICSSLVIIFALFFSFFLLPRFVIRTLRLALFILVVVAVPYQSCAMPSWSLVLLSLDIRIAPHFALTYPSSRSLSCSSCHHPFPLSSAPPVFALLSSTPIASLLAMLWSSMSHCFSLSRPSCFVFPFFFSCYLIAWSCSFPFFVSPTLCF
ncbi:hypothetical protein CPC08DRAFT_343062 [Agrocybe pediades]|nr:hypothetical protein CPC08DRAFT_468094 [Agrocybe pediades]KAF9548865.1 hypothetical protein CPC08DRAFT_343062 [Agrocybe pediades]